MPLKLVTGPANAAKAGEVLGGLRARLDEEPVLVVPSFADVEHTQRELAERGAVFGARVMRFELAVRGDRGARRLRRPREASDFQRELIVEEAVRRARLDVLAESAAQPGFVRAAARFFAELGALRDSMSAARLTRALRDWAGDGPAPPVRGGGRGHLPRLPRRARGGRAGRRGAVRLARARRAARAASGAGRRRPGAARPVFVYGFDDFDGLQLDALEMLGRPLRRGRDGLAALRARPARVQDR